MKINPEDCAPVEVYKLLIGSITPRPIAFVSSTGTNGVHNLAPFSFFTAISANPPVIGFSPVLNAQQNVRDTRANIEASGDFVVNIVSESFVIGRVVHFHIDDELFDNFRIDADALATVGRMGGNAYVRTRDRFDLPRPTLDGVKPDER
jgi:flavin reductase (DIM6/NTAB) family NADH-FMN oxidoreductase RutF